MNGALVCPTYGYPYIWIYKSTTWE
jgi:hypothetical protein